MMQLPLHFWLFAAITAVVFGACVGSFLNVCIYRIPLDQSVVTPRSHCMSCGKLIPWYHNIPVLSYFICRGKCFNCKEPFSFRYAFVELLTALFFVLVVAAYPPIGGHTILGMTQISFPALVPIYWIFLSGLIVATFVDFDHYIIPDSVSIGGSIAGIIFSFIVPELHGQSIWWQGGLYGILGFVAGFVPLQLLRLGFTWYFRKRGRIEQDEYAMGFGDIKLMGAVGAFLGYQAAGFSILAGAFLGTVIALHLLLCGKRKLLDKIPFGPYLSLGAIIYLFWGEAIIGAYLRLLIG
ncbi:MAG: prepilin peptidase [Kiritimatiellae bacterium]|nr:prepilin peptidase [Kiritimatiellia bacterium]